MSGKADSMGTTNRVFRLWGIDDLMIWVCCQAAAADIEKQKKGQIQENRKGKEEVKVKIKAITMRCAGITYASHQCTIDIGERSGSAQGRESRWQRRIDVCVCVEHHTYQAYAT